VNAASPPVSPGTHGSPRARKWSKIIVPIVVLGLIAFSFLNVYITLNREQLPDEIEGLRLYPGLVNEVVEGPIDYPVRPPYGGPNAGVVQDCGQYRVPVQDENAVASLAIGAVWIAYDPELPEDDIDMIHAHASGELYVIVAPYPGLRAPIVLSAWGAQLEVESPLDVRIQAFLRDFKENPDVPNPKRPCSGGVTIPS
jgi:hypothetical protein